MAGAYSGPMKTYPAYKIFDKHWSVIYIPEEIEYKIRYPVVATAWHRQTLYKDGARGTEPHRIGSPAIEYDNGSKQWYEYGSLHRKDGPAVIDVNEDGVIWCFRGRQVTCYAEYQRFTDCSDGDIIIFRLKYGEIRCE